MMPPRTYIMVVRNVEYWLIGPFADRAAAGQWANEHWDRRPGHDDPRWQTVNLAFPGAPPSIFSPGQAIATGCVP